MDSALLYRKDVKYSCKYPSCKNSYKSNSLLVCKNKRFFRFPKDPSTLKRWNDICKISPSENNSNFRICVDHFSVSDFNQYDPKRHLNKMAVPRSSQVTNLRNGHNFVRQPQPKNLYPDEPSLSNDFQIINLPIDHDYVRQFQPRKLFLNEPSNNYSMSYVLTGHNNPTNYPNPKIKSCDGSFLAEHDYLSTTTLVNPDNIHH